MCEHRSHRKQIAIGAAMLVCSMFGVSEARPRYSGYVRKLYSAKKVACAICHPAKEKRKLNCYGQALKIELRDPKANIGKSEQDVIKALQRIEQYRCVQQRKTFGDLIKSGYAPCSNTTKCGDPVKPNEQTSGSDDLPLAPPLPTLK